MRNHKNISGDWNKTSYSDNVFYFYKLFNAHNFSIVLRVKLSSYTTLYVEYCVLYEYGVYKIIYCLNKR